MIDQQGRVFNVEVVNLRILLLLTYRGGRGGGGGVTCCSSLTPLTAWTKVASGVREERLPMADPNMYWSARLYNS